jgi:hypothetical protein
MGAEVSGVEEGEATLPLCFAANGLTLPGRPADSSLSPLASLQPVDLHEPRPSPFFAASCREHVDVLCDRPPFHLT